MSHTEHKPELHTVNSTSNTTHKAISASGKRFKIGGLNLPAHQAVHLPSGQKNETLIIPSSSTLAFGSFFSIDVREKGVQINEMVLQFNYSACGGTFMGISIPRGFTSPALRYIRMGK